MKKNIKIIINLLKNTYLNPKCTLNYTKDFELLIAARLSAQCTDKTVNLVTEKLFYKFKTLDDYSNIKNLPNLKQLIKPCGLHNIKSKQIYEMTKILIKKHNYNIPSKLNELLDLPGIGLKTANLILGTIFNKNNVIICDTHCIRLCNNLKLVNTKNPILIEKILKKLILSNEQKNFCHRLVEHGRKICKAKNPKCNICILKNYCIHFL